MISMWDLKKFMEGPKNDTKMRISEDFKRVIDTDGNDYGPSDRLLEMIQKGEHCWFECIYSEHASLTTVYRCRECGTVIFSGDDERWEPALRCPTCSDYKPVYATYYTKEDMETDPKKKAEVDTLIQFQAEMDAAYERRKRRGGLYDWEIWKKQKFFKNYGVSILLGRMNQWGKPLKGLYLDITISKRDENGISFFGKHYIKIPLSLYAFYIQFIVPHTKHYKEVTKRIRGEKL